MKISENFTLEEFIKSQTATRHGISNMPGLEETCNIFMLVSNVIQPLRELIRQPIYINSGYRGPKLNAMIGGAPNSQHMTGQAADIESPGISNLDLFYMIKDHLDYDQLILEFHNPKVADSGWVHVSFVSDGKNRKQHFSIG